MKQLLVIVGILAMVGNSAFAQATKSYNLLLSLEESEFNPQRISVNLSIGEIGGTIDIYLNDKKISDYKANGKMLRLPVIEGENTLRLEGKTEKEIYLLITEHVPIIESNAVQGYKDGRIITKEILTKEKMEVGYTYKFNVE